LGESGADSAESSLIWNDLLLARLIDFGEDLLTFLLLFANPTLSIKNFVDCNQELFQWVLFTGSILRDIPCLQATT